jgi:hypothetical protein
MSPSDVVQRIGEPGRIKNGQGDDCFQWYRYPPVELTMRCFSRDAKNRRGAGLDLALADIHIEFSGDEPLVLPEAITPRPIASAASLRLEDTHRLLTERGVEMVRDHEQVLRRPLREVDRQASPGPGSFAPGRAVTEEDRGQRAPLMLTRRV